MIMLGLVLLGLILGSFVNAFVWRLRKKRDWVRERSECTHCHHALAPQDLVPVLSWLWLRGKCRYCHKPIEDSPLVEISVAALFVISYIYWPLQMQGSGLFRFVLWLVFLVGFAALTLYDLKWFLLPNKIVFPLVWLAAFGLLARVIFFHESWHILVGAAAGAAIVSGLFYVLFQLSGGKWIGGGDVKLGIVLGALAGGALESLLLLFAASVSGLVASLPQLLGRGAKRHLIIPFGPFLIAGAIIVQLFGRQILDWYLQILGV